MAVIAISAGHNADDPGAGYDGFYEHPETVRWAGLIAHHLSELGQTVFVAPTVGLRDKVAFINARQPDFALEVHFNAAITSARGSETLYYPGSLIGKEAARVVQAAIALHFQPSRGIKEGWYRMDTPYRAEYEGDVDGQGGEWVDYFLRATVCPSIIVEPAFIHQREEIERKRADCCRDIACALDLFLT